MAKSDIIVKWKADTKDYDANIAKAKRTLEGFSKQNLTAGGQLQMLTKSLVGTAAKFASFGAAAAGAMKVMKDAFGASEALVDEWGRTVAASKSVYEGFLTSINNGDISGFLGRIDQIVQAARAAYDELDKLGSMQTIQAPQVSAQQAENTRMRMMLMTGKWISAPGKDSLGFKDGQVLTPAQMKSIERSLERGVQTLIRLTGNEVKQAGEAIEAVYKSFGADLGMTEKEFRKGTSSWAEFTKRVEGAAKFQQWENEHTANVNGTMASLSISSSERNPYEQYRGWDTFRVDGPRYAEMVQLLQRRDQMASSVYSQQGQAYRAINRADARISGGSGGGARGGAGTTVEGGLKGVMEMSEAAVRTSYSLKELNDQLSMYREQMMTATNGSDYRAAQAGIEKTQQRIAWSDSAMRLGVDVDYLVESVNGALEEARERIEPLEITPTDGGKGMSNLVKYADQAQEAFQMAAQSVGTLGSALAGLEDPAVKAAGTVLQAIASITLGFAQASVQAAGLGPFGWVAFMGAGLAALATTIATVHSLTHLQEGGIVPGNYYSGDNINGGGAMVNAGELVLTRAQQATLASQLQGGDGSGQGRQPYVSGEQIYLGVTNYLRRSGRGEIVTTR